MQTPEFLSIEDVIEVHDDSIERYGGSLGVRDRGLLESAVNAPQASFGGQFLHGDLYEMAAAYLYHLVCNHPFIDGNKRVGAACAAVFLKINGISLEAQEPEFGDMVLAVAQGRMEKPAIAEFLRQHSTLSS